MGKGIRDLEKPAFLRRPPKKPKQKKSCADIERDNNKSLYFGPSAYEKTM